MTGSKTVAPALTYTIWSFPSEPADHIHVGSQRETSYVTSRSTGRTSATATPATSRYSHRLPTAMRTQPTVAAKSIKRNAITVNQPIDLSSGIPRRGSITCPDDEVIEQARRVRWMARNGPAVTEGGSPLKGDERKRGRSAERADFDP